MHQPTRIIKDDCLGWLRNTRVATEEEINLTFFDPPFNQGRFYRQHDDNQEHNSYWEWITNVLSALCVKTQPGGAVYFMHREKNTEFVLTALRQAGWTFQNLIVWKKMASAVPCRNRFGKHYQIIVLATKGAQPRVFHKLRIDPPLMAHQKHDRKAGVYVTDVWDDIRELTSGYFAGKEPMRTPEGERFHKQQSPIALLLRIILSSSNQGDTVFDPFAGTGTTLVVAKQLKRKAIGVEIDPQNIQRIKERIKKLRAPDQVEKYFHYYRHTQNVDAVWGKSAASLFSESPDCHLKHHYHSTLSHKTSARTL